LGRAFWSILLFFILTETGLVAESIVQKFGTFIPYFGEGMMALSMGLWIGVLGLWLRQFHFKDKY
jgi:ABC-type microcin C transport system permease subunit YejE